MSIGSVSARYGEALLRFAGNGDAAARVYAQALAIEKRLVSVPDLERSLSDPEAVSPGEKLRLLSCAVAPEPLAGELSTFFALVIRRGRADMLRFILQSYARKYEDANGIISARIITVVPLGAEMLRAVREKACSMTGKDVRFEASVDPDIIGGAVIMTGNRLLDASVRRQLEVIRGGLVKTQKRIL